MRLKDLPHDEAMRLAFSRVAEATGVPSGASPASTRSRSVTLGPLWPREDRGPLIGIRNTGEAVALLPRRRGGSIALGPEGEVSPGEIQPLAWQLYPDLPSRPLTPKDLSKFRVRTNDPDARKLLIVATSLSLFAAIAIVLVGVIADTVIPHAERLVMTQITAALFVAASASALLMLVRETLVIRLAGRGAMAFHAALWSRVLTLPPRFFRLHSSLDIAENIRRLAGIQASRQGGLRTLSIALPGAAFGLFVMIYLNAALTLIGIALAAPVVILKRRRRPDNTPAPDRLAFEIITNLAKLRVAGREEAAWQRWRAAQTQPASRPRIPDLAAYWLVPALILFGIAAQPVGLGAGDFLGFAVAYCWFLWGLLGVTHSLDAIRSAHAGTRKNALLEAAPEPGVDLTAPGPLTGAIDVSDATFRYDPEGRRVLDGVSFHVRTGEFVAIAGPSGSGKSTLLRLLLGFETPESGIIRFDDHPLADLDPRALRRQFGVVLQDTRLVPGDIYRNIAGDAPLTLDEAWQAAGLAGIADEIRAMPMQMQTLVADGSPGLSGGQSQRIAIARALARRPRILLLDEATSSLDPAGQAAINHTLTQLGITRIVIAHRLDTIRNADRLLLLRDGLLSEHDPGSDLAALLGDR